MPKLQAPELKKYMEKRLRLKLNANRIVTGILRGYDQFMNITLDDCREVNQEVEGPTLGMVVIRGSSVMLIEALERL